jgi:hypothetical protein
MDEVSSNGSSASERDERTFRASAERDERTFRASASSAIFPPAELSDAELLAATRRLVGRSNQLLASLLAHLAEVETRGIHRIRACSSLFHAAGTTARNTRDARVGSQRQLAR